MRVRNSLNKTTNISGITVKDDTKIKAGKSSDFHNRLARAENADYEQYLEKLVRDITKQGEILAKKVDIRELKIYKRLIAEFLELVLGHSKKFSKVSLLDRRGRHRVFAIIKNINSELDLLTEEVLKGEKDNINLLKRLEDIRGLILDLFA